MFVRILQGLVEVTSRRFNDGENELCSNTDSTEFNNFCEFITYSQFMFFLYIWLA